MNAFEGVIDDLNSRDLPFISKIIVENLSEIWDKYESYLKKIQRAIEVYQQTGEEPDINFCKWEGFDEENDVAVTSNNPGGKNSLKENVNPAKDAVTEAAVEKRVGRPRRNAFIEATLNITQQSSVSLANVVVKKEKESLKEHSVKIEVKQDAEEMPAPTKAAPRKKRQKKFKMSKTKQEKIDEEKTFLSANDSDILIVENKPVTINVDSDDNEKTIKIDDENRRTTRQKKRTAKHSRTPSSDEKGLASADKKTISNQEAANANITTETHYEDANSHLEENKETISNATFVTENPVNENLTQSNAVNVTVVVPNPKFHVITTDDLLTDDESAEEEKGKKTPPKTVTKAVSKFKQVFSAFEPSPVKKKIQAFERLQEENNAIPVRVTRTKTKTQTKENEKEKDCKQMEPKSTIKEKAKFFTPDISKFIPTVCSTSTKTRICTPSTSTESLSTSKAASSLKVSQHEFKQREKRRREKEEEALKKREALLQAQIEERKRKNEQKQLKAQLQREILEKEKLKVLEVQKLKDERHKQLIAEQEEKKQKQREEMEKKRMMAKQRAIEEKKKEEERKLEEAKKAEEIKEKMAKQDEEMARLVQKQKRKREQKQKLPIYMTTKTPLLPTPDCFDTDDENDDHTSGSITTWDKKENLKQLEILSLAVAESAKNAFFSRQAQTPDLQEIFEVIAAQKLKRTSSAVWHVAPRFTMMPDILPKHEESLYETDDE